MASLRFSSPTLPRPAPPGRPAEAGALQENTGTTPAELGRALPVVESTGTTPGAYVTKWVAELGLEWDSPEPLEVDRAGSFGDLEGTT